MSRDYAIRGHTGFWDLEECPRLTQFTCIRTPAATPLILLECVGGFMNIKTAAVQAAFADHGHKDSDQWNSLRFLVRFGGQHLLHRNF